MVIMDESQDFYSESDSNDSDNSLADESTAKRKNKKQGGKNKKAKTDDEVLPKLAKSGKKKNELYKQPTAEELNQLRETQNLFNSNIFRLQIDELLAEVKIKPKYVGEFENWFKEFEEGISKMGDLKNSKKLLSEVKSEVFNNADINLRFDKPKGVFSFGDFNNLNSKEVKFTGHVCVVMPKSCFYEKDFANNKYGTKKFYYMHYVLKFLQKLDCVKSVSIEHYLGNLWQPFLLITPSFSEKARVNLFLVPENGAFKHDRFLPDKNNIKTNILDNIFSNFNIENYASQSTILYNSLLIHDVALESNQRLIKATMNDLTNVLDGIKLLIIWLKQRNLNSNFRGFTNDLLIYSILYLALKRKITKHMSSYQVVRIFWSFMSGLKEGEVLSIREDVKETDLALFNGLGKYVLLDASGCYNVAAFLDGEVFLKTKREAETALKALDNCRFDSFRSLFVTNVPIAVQYDAILKIKSEKDFKSVYKQCTDEEKFKYYGFYDTLIFNRILSYLKFGLNQRVKEIVPIYPSDANISLKTVTFGINLNQESCSSVIEKGPKQFEPGAEEFKKFWGSLAELRRFKDSSIYEAVYFEHAKTLQDRRLIYKHIIDFVMTNKVKLPYELYGHEMEDVIKLDKINAPFEIGSNEEVVLKIKSILYDLSKVMRDLKLPLAITAIQGNSDSYSYTDVFPPIPTSYYFGDTFASNGNSMLFKKENLDKNTLFYVSPIECVIQLALHSKWPKNLEALRAMKLVFLAEISKLLKEQSIRSSIGDDFIDIYYEGLVFRMRLYHPKEVALLKKDVTTDGETFYKDTEESLRLERELDMLPKIYGALNGIQQEHTSFGPSTCLIKRWLRSQMLDDYHVPDIVVNLLNASLFLSPDPFAPAVLPQIAFMRFLKFLSEFDFQNHLISVNFNEELSSDELNDIESKFIQNRHNYGAVCIITPYDNGSSVYSKNTLTENILRRMKCLAAETYKYLSNIIENGNSFKYKACFTPNISGYNLLIHLKNAHNPKRYQRIMNEKEKIKVNEYQKSKNPLIPIVNFSPVNLYINELREYYSDYALFFHDSYGGNVIGVLWNAKALEQADFKISTVGARKLSPEQRLSLNTDALIEDFYTLGRGVVDTIAVQNK